MSDRFDLGEPVSSILSCRGVSASYGRLKVVNDVNLTVARGEVVALIGLNGAGKTSLLGSIVGLVAGSGRIHLENRDISSKSADARARCGLAIVPDNRGLFPSLTVRENLMLGARLISATERPDAMDAAVRQFPILGSRLKVPAGSMSGGEQQMLAIAKALIGRPKLLILDEPSQGLAPRIVGELGEVLANLREDGLPILVAEQNYGLVQRLADRFLLMAGGRVTLEGGPKELADEALIARSFLGSGRQTSKEKK